MGELSNPKENNNLHFTYSLPRNTYNRLCVRRARADVVYNERRGSRGVKSEHLLSHPPKFTSQICNHFLVYVVHIPPSITLPLPLPLNAGKRVHCKFAGVWQVRASSQLSILWTPCHRKIPWHSNPIIWLPKSKRRQNDATLHFLLTLIVNKKCLKSNQLRTFNPKDKSYVIAYPKQPKVVISI